MKPRKRYSLEFKFQLSNGNNCNKFLYYYILFKI